MRFRYFLPGSVYDLQEKKGHYCNIDSQYVYEKGQVTLATRSVIFAKWLWNREINNMDLLKKKGSAHSKRGNDPFYYYCHYCYCWCELSSHFLRCDKIACESNPSIWLPDPRHLSNTWFLIKLKHNNEMGM